MTKSYRKQGNVIPLAAAPYARLSGEGVQMGKQFGVCTTDIANGAEGQIEVTGVHELTALGAEAWTDGAFVYWDDTNKRCTVTASTHLKIGHAVGAKANAAGATLGLVRLTGAAV